MTSLAIDLDAIVALTKRLIAIPTENPPGNGYSECAEVLIDALRALGGFEIRQDGTSDWLALIQEDDYPEGHPQERYGAWTLPSDAPYINLPLGIRLTAATGQQIVNEMVITNWTPPADSISGFWYIDMGINFDLL